MKCDRCSKEAKIVLPYGPHNFCKEHFSEFFEKRVRRTIRNFGLVRSKEHIAIGLSGGKDSVVALYLLNKIFKKGNKITAIIIDEGIPKYRDRAIKIAKKNCEEWGIDYKIYSFREEYGKSLVEIMKKLSDVERKGSSCSYCGVLRRNLLNKKALEIGADKIVTGHNLDDETQSICMNIFDNDVSRLARLGATAGVKSNKKFVPRIKPLYETPEKEIIAFANFENIEYFGDVCCPFKWQAKRNAYRSMLDNMEDKFPGTKYSILNFFLQLKPVISRETKSEPNYCEICGMPSAGKTCKSCQHVEKIFEKEK